MTPESPVVAWLNGAAETIPGELRVIAGDMRRRLDRLVGQDAALRRLLLDRQRPGRADPLDVRRRPTSEGGRRQRRALPARQGRQGLALQLLQQRAHRRRRSRARCSTTRRTSSPAIGPLSWAGEDASGTRAALAVARSRGAAAGAASGGADRPAVFVIPGILGSNLKRDGKRIWLGFRIVNGLKLLAWDPATAASIEPDGPVGSLYGDLIERLADSHEVIPFAYDWRRPVEDEARRLGDEVDAALAARATSQQPVRIVAHSMGGLVARTMAIEKPATWQRMMARDGARFLMLGTPNGGSWSPMQTLSGDDTFGNALAAFGSLFDNGGAREVMAGMPGFLQLQAGLLDPALRLDRSATWQKLADDDMARLLEKSLWHVEDIQRAIYQWSAPPQRVLDQSVALRRRLDAQAAALPDAAKTLLVVGHAPFTPGGIVFGDAGLEYTDAVGGGDGRVPLTSALLPGVRTWKLDAVHGDLPKVAKAFPAFLELLTRGETALLDVFDASTIGLRGAGRRRRSAGAGRRRGERRAQPAVARPPAVGAAVDAGRGARQRRAPGRRRHARRRRREPRAARLGPQRRPQVRAPAARRRPLPLARLDRHRGRRRPARRQCRRAGIPQRPCL